MSLRQALHMFHHSESVALIERYKNGRVCQKTENENEGTRVYEAVIAVLEAGRSLVQYRVRGRAKQMHQKHTKK
jgi:hypothetical protein